MANKKTEKVQISRDCFLRIIREKGYTVESLGEVPEIDRSGKTIQRCLTSGEMQPDLLDRIGRFLDVDQTYLSGEYDRRFEEMKDSLKSPELTHYLWTKTDRFPYSKHETENIDYAEYLLNTLLINNISKEQFLALDPRKRRSLNNGYPYNATLGGGLHRYIIAKWYGEDMLKEMTEKGFIVEHMNNNHMDCRICNLEFMKGNRNVAKGQYFDKESEALRHSIAVSIFKDFTTGNYQITIGCNANIVCKDQGGVEHHINAIKLLYN